MVLIPFTLLSQQSGGGIAENPYPSGPVYEQGTNNGNETGTFSDGGDEGDPGQPGNPDGNDIPFDSGLSILISAGIGFALYRSKKDNEAKMHLMGDE